jgi:hypothetical protein
MKEKAEKLDEKLLSVRSFMTKSNKKLEIVA